MFIEPGTKILYGIHSPHECSDVDYKYEKIRGTLINPSGKKIEYNMLKCNKCGAIVMRGDMVKQIERVYKDYEFVHIPKKPKNKKPPTKRQIRNARYLTECAVADAQGKPRPKKKGVSCMDTPDYVFKGEVPDYMKKNALHPFRGGGVTPK